MLKEDKGSIIAYGTRVNILERSLSYCSPDPKHTCVPPSQKTLAVVKDFRYTDLGRKGCGGVGGKMLVEPGVSVKCDGDQYQVDDYAQ